MSRRVEPAASHAERRVLVLASTARDAGLARSVLERADIECRCCSGIEQVCDEIGAGAGAVLVAEEALAADEKNLLARRLSDQPPWSDLPVLVLARRGADSEAVGRAMSLLGNVAVLERPTRVAALVSALRSALRARQRQYQIREHLAERARVERALRADDRRKDEFLAILAHELRNPLAPICNSLHVLGLAGGGGEAREVARVRETLERQVRHLVRLVDDLVEISRITRGTIELRKERLDMAQIVRTAVEASEGLIDAAEHELILSMPDEPLALDADPVRMTQVLANLLNNAAKYSEPGGRIWLDVRREDDAIAIHVRDSGIGIPTEMLPRVFDMFVQVRDSASPAPGGLGIGLTLVQRLVELHGGTVHAASEGSGRGSEFVVRLPAAPDAVEREPVAASLRRQRGPLAGRVLVVDDNRDAADTLGMLLRACGSDVRVAYGGPEALGALDDFRPTLVLLDIGMPDMDGFEVARRMRRDPALRDVTLVALTGWGQEEDVRRSRAAGFDHHLVKPVDLDALETLIAQGQAAQRS